MAARIIQHEFDHIEGKLFTDHISPLKRNLLKAKLANISAGRVPNALQSNACAIIKMQLLSL